MSDNFEEYKAYKIKRSLMITESTAELMDVMNRIIKKLDKSLIPYTLNLDMFNDDCVHIGYNYGAFEIKINKFSIIVEICKDYDYSSWRYEIIDDNERYFDECINVFNNKKKMIDYFVKSIKESL